VAGKNYQLEKRYKMLRRLVPNARSLSESKVTNISRMFSTTVFYRDDADDVLFDTNNSTQIITLNRSDQLNALNLSMINKLTPNYRKHILSDDQKIKTFVIKGKGEKAFCAGGDIKGSLAEVRTLNVDQQLHRPKMNIFSMQNMN
jgi:1,4-dihydroxy-2-naphthoyl-CoA synthase